MSRAVADVVHRVAGFRSPVLEAVAVPAGLRDEQPLAAGLGGPKFNPASMRERLETVGQVCGSGLDQQAEIRLPCVACLPRMPVPGGGAARQVRRKGAVSPPWADHHNTTVEDERISGE